MPNISITVKNKVARADRAIIVCDNSDYTAVFDFDAEWDEYTTKTARFAYCGKYTDVVFTGNECPVPVIQDTRAVTVGVFAGDLHTTTPAYFACVPSILCGNGIPADPTPDVYNQLMELLNKDSGVWYPTVDDAGNMSWTRSMSETEPQPVNIKGPKGDAGADGIGIPGADGKDGADGKSAYELAQDNGFQGTMQEWLASLVGADGANGADGNDGISPAVSVTAITGGNRVTITDAEGAKTFDVMDGAQGASGADGKDYVLTDADKQEIAETAAGLVDVPSVQPDWNQNNSTQPDYVKNRPFYTGDPVETVLVEESTVSFADYYGVYMAQFSSTFSATVGETYKVYWDGAVYECTCVKVQNNPTIGNLSIAGTGSDTGEPFVMQVANGARIAIATADTAASHTISISGLAPEVVKIDPKYLPDNVATKADVEAVQTTASNAQTTASNAQTTASNAQTTASNAKSEALDLAARMFGHTSVVDNAFDNDKTLSITSLPACIESIGSRAFSGCTNLALTSLPSGITSIGSNAFQSCTGLTSITFTGKPTSIANNVFDGCTNLTTINVPWAEGEVANAPWGATNATINYNYTEA